MDKKSLLETSLAPCHDFKPYWPYKDSVLGYYASAQVVNGNVLDIAVYNLQRQPLARILIDKDGSNCYNYGTQKWDRRTMDTILSVDDRSGWQYSTSVHPAEKHIIKDFLIKYLTYRPDCTEIDNVELCLYDFRTRSSRLRREEAAKKEEELRKYVMDNIPDLPSDIDDYIRENVMRNSRYIFFSKKDRNGKRPGRCSHCGKTSYLRGDVKHKSKGKCPYCNSKVIYRAIYISHLYLEDEDYFTIMQKKGDDIFTCTYHCWWNYCVFPDVSKGIRLVSVSCFVGKTHTFVNFSEGSYRRKCGSTYASGGVWYTEYHDYRHEGEHVYPLPDLPLFRTEKYRLITSYWNRTKISSMLCYMIAYKNLPLVQKLLAGKFSQLGKEVAEKCHEPSLPPLNLKASTMEGVFRLPRQEINMIRDHQCSLDEIKTYKKLRAKGLKCNPDIFYWVKELSNFSLKYFLEFLETTTPIKIKNYYLKQKELHPDCFYNLQYFLQYWRDYHGMCKKLDYDIDQSILFCPRDLKEKHDEVARIQREIQAEKQAAAFAAEAAIKNPKIMMMAQKYDKQLSYSNGHYHIRSARDVHELLEEGTVLDHCVSSYSSKIITGDSAVLFVRSIKEPDQPLCTVDFSPQLRKVVQCSGRNNAPPVEAVKQFIEEWKDKKKIA